MQSSLVCLRSRSGDDLLTSNCMAIKRATPWYFCSGGHSGLASWQADRVEVGVQTAPIPPRGWALSLRSISTDFALETGINLGTAWHDRVTSSHWWLNIGKWEFGVSHVDERNGADWLALGTISFRKFPTIEMRTRGTSETGIKLFSDGGVLSIWGQLITRVRVDVVEKIIPKSRQWPRYFHS